MAWFLNQQIGNIVKANKVIDPGSEVNWVNVEGNGWVDINGKWYISPAYISFIDIEGAWQDLIGNIRR